MDREEVTSRHEPNQPANPPEESTIASIGNSKNQDNEDPDREVPTRFHLRLDPDDSDPSSYDEYQPEIPVSAKEYLRFYLSTVHNRNYSYCPTHQLFIPPPSSQGTFFPKGRHPTGPARVQAHLGGIYKLL